MSVSGEVNPSWVEGRIAAGGAPIVDGQQAVFVWKGRRPPRLAADFLGQGTGEVLAELENAGRDLWIYTAEIPEDAYVEYYFEDDTGRLLDRFNKRKIYDGVVGFKNYFGMPAWRPSGFLGKKRGVAGGTVTKHRLSGLFRVATTQRDVFLYEPPMPGPYPLLVVLDGQDYLSRGRLAIMVDNLIAAKRIRPIAMALPAHGKAARFVEYDASEATLGFLEHDVLPLAGEHLHLIDGEGEFGILGASMGGLMAVFAALLAPEIFGKALSQSGALGGEWWGRTSLLPSLIEALPRARTRLWMDVGIWDVVLAANREMGELLGRKGYDFTYREYSGGHNYTCWRNDLPRGLELMFPPL